MSVHAREFAAAQGANCTELSMKGIRHMPCASPEICCLPEMWHSRVSCRRACHLPFPDGTMRKRLSCIEITRSRLPNEGWVTVAEVRSSPTKAPTA